MEPNTLTVLIESSDLDGLVKHIDGLVSARDWDGIEVTRDRCREAVERGKQVWGPAEYAEYRLALDSPADRAAAVIGDGKGRYGPGPLWEVAASTHPWSDLGPHIATPTVRALIAHERAIRGDEVAPSSIDGGFLEIPPRLQPWEPQYPVAVYREDGVDFPEGDRTPLAWVDLPDTGVRLAEDGAAEMLHALVRPWWDESSGHADVVHVEGGAEAAIRVLGPHRARLADVTLREALSAMVWTGASGGAYGSRRGTPVGRSLTWWVLAGLLGYDEMPEDPGALAEASELRWVLWDPGDSVGGWALHLAVEDPDDGVAWAVSAVDMA
ncbi:MAG: hypothetical protein ABFS21_02420 [Actinomycetota bacterium]